MVSYKRANGKDERITNLKNKIYAEIYILIIFLCAISVFVKVYFYDMRFEGIVTELLILFISGGYYLYRSTRLGIFSAEVEMHDSKSRWPQKKKNLYTGIALGIGFALVFGINSAVQYAEGTTQSIYYFLLTAFVSLLIYLPFFLIILVIGHDVAKKNSDDAVNKMLEDDESGDEDEKY